MRAWTTAIVVILVPACGVAAAQEAPCAACLAVSVTPGQAMELPDALGGLDVLVRVVAGDEAAALEGLGEIARKGGRAGLAVAGVPSDALAPELVTRIARLLIDLGEADLGDAPQADVAALAYAVKLRLTAARARAAGGISLGIAGPPAVVSALLANDLGPYVDFIVWNGPPASDRRGHEVWQRFAPGRPESVAAALLAARAAGVDRWLWPMPADAGLAAPLVSDLARAAALLPRGLVESSSVTVACGGVPAAAYLNPETLETVALARACPPDAALTVTPSAPGVERVTLATGDAIVRVPAAGAQDRFAEGVQVVGARELTVEEIVARHQAAAARQAAAVRDLISTGALTLSFEAPGFPAPLVISSEAVMYSSAGVTELEQRAVRVNGVEFRGGSVPRLPIIEPERVASPPLAITLTGVYRYRLAGRDRIGGTSCYVVAFDPIDRAAPLFRGRAWIAADSFAMVKVAAAQTGLRGPIVASEQVDDFREERQGIWLLARSDVRQMYEGAAHRTPIHRVLSMASARDQPARLSGAAAGGLRVRRGDAARHARRAIGTCAARAARAEQPLPL